jgi:signal peptidase I
MEESGLEPVIPVAIPAAGAPLAPRRFRHAARVAWEILHDVAMAVLFVVFVVTFVAQAFRVEGTSMLPLLEDGERIIVNKLVTSLRPIHRGDVVVFYYPLEPTTSFIKRIVGLPGDTVEIRNGILHVNGKPLREDYLTAAFRDHDDMDPVTVEQGHYYVLGDHRNGSNDSRTWGTVPERYIYGKAFFRFWPPRRIGLIQH